MSKITLSKKTYRGGGKVLSLILAGSLAFGMTPAVALSQAALGATPAYAAASSTEATTVVDGTLDSWTAGNEASDLEVTFPDSWKPEGAVYKGTAYEFALADLSVTATVAQGANEELVWVGDAPNEKDDYVAKLDTDCYTVTSLNYTPVGGNKTDLQINTYLENEKLKLTKAGTYEVGIDVKGIAGAPDSGTEAVTTTITVGQATAAVSIPSTGVFGSASPKSVYESVSVVGVNGKLDNDSDLDITIEDAEGDKIEDAKNNGKAFSEPTTVKVKVELKDDVAVNYESIGKGGTYTQNVTIAAATTGTYVFGWKTTGATTVTAPAATPTRGSADYAGTMFTEAALEGSMTAKYFAPGEDPKDPSVVADEVAIDAFDVTWFQGETALVDDEGEAVRPTNPGVYTAKIRPAGAPADAPAVGELQLTVQANLASDVAIDAENTAGAPITVTVNDRYPSDVLLGYKEGITVEDVKKQILDGMVVTYKDGTVIKGAENVAKVFDVKVTDLLVDNAGGKDGAKGTASMTYAGSDGAFTADSLTIEYAYGNVLPQPEALEAVAYNPNGYNVSEMVKVKDADGQPIAASGNYTVTAYATDKDGKEVAVTSPTEAGTYKVVVEADPTGDYVGTVDPLTLTINKAKVTDANTTYTWDGATLVDGTFSADYTGKPLAPKPGVAVKFDVADTALAGTTKPLVNLNIVLKEDYDAAKDKAGIDGYVAYANNTNATKGGAVATVTYVGNYEGEKVQNFSIAPKDISSSASVKAQNRLAADFPAFPTAADVLNPVVKMGDEALVQGVDYEIVNVTRQSASVDGVTPYKFEVRGKGNYTGTNATGTFNVCEKDVADAAAALADEDELFFYDGNIHTPEVVVNEAPAEGSTTLGKALVKGDDYTVTYEKNVDAGTAAAVIVGMGDYAGEARVKFEIQPLQLDGASADGVALDGAEGLTYNGKAFTPDVLWGESELLPANEGYEGDPILLQDFVDDFKVSYENNDKASAPGAPAYVVLSGKTGNFEGELKVPFEIAPAELTADNVSVAGPVAPGAPVSDAVKVTFGDAILTADVDYAVESEDELPGKATVTVTGKGNFSGTVTKDIEVLYDLSGVQFKVASTTYNGKPQTPTVTEAYYMKGGEKVAVPAEAYAQAADSYVDAGDYTAKFSGNEAAGWTGKGEASFVIDPAAGPKTAEVTYTAAGAYKVTVLGLVEGVDFTVTPNPAQKKLVITYTGNYAGTATVGYDPAPAPAPAPAKDGWVGSGNDWAYYEGGKQVKGGWKWIDDAWYHFEANGQMTNTQWFQDADGTWYLLNQSHKGSYGAMLTGWQFVDGGWYYLNKSGAMQSGWLKDADGTWYLLNSKHDGTFGKMLTGWQKVGGKWYYMDASGAMAENEWVGRYWVDGSGVWTATR
ncbi:N-acetylmuramoyl-L-alanine amidase family protein [Xiamenia xianingshaonis]|uniref:N-acetylmuramoyl-L-alanine amidase family protein n=1 Tax=Xiamenia xianingshaonis TaxID=2682776 RepID=UPI00140B3118|nr:N-acetylmuramoyl-L-alanine amidase family protein [Xiamenia xianingshaonis]